MIDARRCLPVRARGILPGRAVKESRVRGEIERGRIVGLGAVECWLATSPMPHPCHSRRAQSG